MFFGSDFFFNGKYYCFFFSDCKVMIEEKEKNSLGSHLGGGERG